MRVEATRSKLIKLVQSIESIEDRYLVKTVCVLLQYCVMNYELQQPAAVSAELLEITRGEVSSPGRGHRPGDTITVTPSLNPDNSTPKRYSLEL